MADPQIPSHIRAIAGRSMQETDALAFALMRQAWPAGAEGTSGIGREWVRRWTPATTAFTPDCGCAAGRCGTCN
jgi:hypothetical protein